jgi:hypothetical protein
MKNGIFALLFAAITLTMLSGCFNENYSNGTRTGMVTKFSKQGNIWKSYEGLLNITQTGMNSSGEPFEFSIDNDEPLTVTAPLIAKIDSAQTYGWLVELSYHETFGKNWFGNRGSTNHFITECKVIKRNPMQGIFTQAGLSELPLEPEPGQRYDTIYPNSDTVFIMRE